ncbi:MAG: hypothetical protein RL641_432 [Candidatus Parcubacteria bacterium]|jgi:hypothetical protein
MRNNLVLITILFCCVSCHKDSINSDSICINLPPSPSIGWTYLIDTPNYSFPFFNPNNPSEIIFQKKNYSAANTVLYRFNLLTKQKSILFTGENLYQPKWGKNGWILLNTSDNNIWKIKEDGNSLIQLTYNSTSFAPEWNQACDKIAYFKSDGISHKLFIMDENGNNIDSATNYFSSQSCWRHPNLIATITPLNLIVIDPIADTVKILHEINTGIFGGAYWLSDHENIIWSYEEGIFITNCITKATHCINASCNTRTYLFPTYAPQTNKVIFNKVEKKAINATEVKVSSKLYIMNVDGSGESELDLN